MNFEKQMWGSEKQMLHKSHLLYEPSERLQFPNSNIVKRGCSNILEMASTKPNIVYEEITKSYLISKEQYARNYMRRALMTEKKLKPKHNFASKYKCIIILMLVKLLLYAAFWT